MRKNIHRLDIRGAIAPITFLKVTQAFRKIKPGEILEIQGDDSDTREELFRVLNRFQYRIAEIEDQSAFYRICLKKEAEEPVRKERKK
jgi:TusA-related sulfurtransferase